ncbi:C-type lectin 1-like isoform X1 [Pollicipes pollicipes]|uniref:C-type lectin 1-like isoform X1 n=1 Tax=Pollicipes pollicipes TaxID=41117 RepID=UPI0018852FAD|nr:C-type lectin 1-like isoform X1 [Pollicipes pollicipes]
MLTEGRSPFYKPRRTLPAQSLAGLTGLHSGRRSLDSAIGDSMLPGREWCVLLAMVLCLPGSRASCNALFDRKILKQVVKEAIAEAGLTAGDGCPDGFVPCAGRCYTRLNTAVSYDRAEQECAELDAHLAVPRTRNQNLCVAGLAGYERVWLGITDREEEGVFKAADGGVVTASEAHWSKGQPDNTVNLEHCVELWNPTTWPGVKFGEWNDWVCTGPAFPMCQLDSFKDFIIPRNEALV